MGDTVRIKGKAHDWGSVIFRIAGERYHGFGSIGYSEKREGELVYGQSRSQAPRGRTSGKYTPENLKLGEVEASTIAIIKKQFADADGSTCFGNAELPITLQYVEGDEIITIEFIGCTIATAGRDESSGSASKGSLEFQVLGVVENGLTLFDQE